MAQKTIEKQWDAIGIDTLSIVSDDIYEIRLITNTSEEIRISASVEGEYYESVVLNSMDQGRSLEFSTGFSPYFIKDNDKLAAHKVLSIILNLSVPEKMAVLIQSRGASLRASGKLMFLSAILSEGNINLINYTGDGRLFSKKGDISIEVGLNVGGRGTSTHGSVLSEIPLEGHYFVEASSIHGDVYLLKGPKTGN